MQQPTYIHENEKLNPFFSIWLSTRKTIRYVLENKSLKYALIIAAIAGIPNGFNALGELSSTLNFQLGVLILASLVIGPFLSLLGVGLSSLIFTFVGKWMGGVGTFGEMAKAMGVVTIPAIWLSPYFILSSVITYNGNQVDPLSGISASMIIWMIFSALIMIIYSIWMIVIQSQSIGEVHQFSSWRGFATLMIPAIVFFIIGIIFVMMFFAAIVI
ncbi:YIP1 family protein [Paenisporosarcina quisquiliarum]|uniref:YIP1 family protein n=1 Tax=Paenisporosarcina quisquiliarum TaxID=365346 RepID=UPI0037354943